MSSCASDNNKEEEKEDMYTYIRTRISKTTKCTFYQRAQDQILFDQLTKILKREGRSLSQWIREQAEPYVRLHTLGNPQQLLDRIIEKGAYLAPKVCDYGDGKLAVVKVHVEGEKNARLLCPTCFKRFQSHRIKEAWTYHTLKEKDKK